MEIPVKQSGRSVCVCVFSNESSDLRARFEGHWKPPSWSRETLGYLRPLLAILVSTQWVCEWIVISASELANIVCVPVRQPGTEM
jgi:hypothetical protein